MQQMSTDNNDQGNEWESSSDKDDILPHEHGVMYEEGEVPTTLPPHMQK